MSSSPAHSTTPQAPTLIPIEVRCRLCTTTLTLNPDSLEARSAGTDPRQQLRQHLATHRMDELARHTHRIGWLIDMLAFMPLNEQVRWSTALTTTLDHFSR